MATFSPSTENYPALVIFPKARGGAIKMYKIAAIPTRYNGVQFRSRLEARWAAFFDLYRWEWIYEPIDIKGWVPDFHLNIPCTRCDVHELYVEVKPANTLLQLDHWTSPLLHQLMYGEEYLHPCPAMFGAHPLITIWWTVSCSGGSAGITSLEYLMNKNYKMLWDEAGNIIQWLPGKEHHKKYDPTTS